jgi:hypothetical protein
MIWDIAVIKALSRIVDNKYDELQGVDYVPGLEGGMAAQLRRWKEYLDLHGIERKPMQLPRRRNGGAPCVFI